MQIFTIFTSISPHTTERKTKREGGVMKTLNPLLTMLAAILLMPAPTAAVTPREEKTHLTVNGVVKDRNSKKVIPYANINVVGSPHGTVSNDDGDFTLKIARSATGSDISIEISHLGYYNSQIKVDSTSTTEKLTIWLSPAVNQLREVVITGYEPRRLVEEAVSKIVANYDANPRLLTGFYRETAQKKKRYINVSEAVVDLYKTSYRNPGVEQDRVQLIKGRKLISTKVSDTLAVKLLGGPVSAVYLDVVKNPDLLLSPEMLDFYDFYFEEMTSIDRRLQYVVGFRPRRVLPYALYNGRFYIDRERLSFTRAEFSLDLSDLPKAIQSVLHRKPAGLRFRPTEVSYRVSYIDREGRSDLNYVYAHIAFKCDWKRKLFSTNYAIQSEMVVTDRQPAIDSRISWKDSFKPNEVLSDDVSSFYDEDFWGAYNIIEPSESLEHAVKRLKRQRER